MDLTITHTTRYSYEQPVQYALQKARLWPADNPLQSVLEWDILVENGRVELTYSDHLRNAVALVSANRAVTEIVITAQGRVQTTDTAGILGKVYGRAPLWFFQEPTERTRPGRGIRKLAREVTGEDQVSRFHALSAAILDAVPYTTGQTDTGTSAEDALALGAGVCQDHAQIFIAAARAAGFPARYVSGYLMMNDRVDQDASHGWAEVHLDDLGWVGFDVSNGICPDERYVRLAIGRDAREAAPISGMRFGRGDESMIVSVQVQQ